MPKHRTHYGSQTLQYKCTCSILASTVDNYMYLHVVVTELYLNLFLANRSQDDCILSLMKASVKRLA